MEFLTLRLGAPLSWNTIPPAPPEVGPDKSPPAFAVPVLAREGSEAVFIWTREQLASDSEDGPHLRSPLPQPLKAGISDNSGASTSQHGRIVLPAGTYLFCQGRLKDTESIEQTLEWFFREAWWTRTTCRGPVYLRLIREDAKTAVQVIVESSIKE